MRLIIYILVTGAAIAQPTISNVRIPPGPLSPSGLASHSTAILRYNLSVSACWQQVQVTNQSSGLSSIQINNSCGQNDVGWSLSGLGPGITYTYSISASIDGVHYTASPATGSFTLPGAPAIDPAPPQISGLWIPPQPNSAGYQTFTMDSTCTQTSPHSGHTISQTANDAVTLQPTQGSLVNIPPGAPCGPINFPNDTQILTVPEDSSHVNTTTGVFTATNAPWTIANGNTVRLNGASCLPGSYTQGNDNNSFERNGCIFNGPFTFGTTYYMVGVSGSTFQLSATLGGSAIVPGDTGQVSGTMGLQQWPPQNSNWIIFQTTTPDSTFCPVGVRCMGNKIDGTPLWQPKMATITAACGQNNTVQTESGLMNHHIWFRGIEWTDSSCASLANPPSGTIDPQPSGNIIDFPYTWVSNYIVFDRNYFHGQPLPNRYKTFMVIGGANIAMINSDFENIEFWRPTASPPIWNGSVVGSAGLSGSISSSTITIIPGSMKAPLNNCTTTANVTFTTVSAAGSGPASTFLDPFCVPTAYVPGSTSGSSCTGTATDKNSVSHGCAVVNTGVVCDSNGCFPHDGSGGINAFTLGTFTLTSGVPSNYSSLSTFNVSSWYFEGAQAIQAGAGPGPVSYLNNYFESTGLVLHVTDDTAIAPVGFWFRQNLVNYLSQYKAGSPTWNGYEYAQRNGPELKQGQQVMIDGNVFQNCWASVSLTSPCLLTHIGDTNPGTQTYFYVADVDITNNSFWLCATCIDLGGQESLGHTSNPSASRIRVKNNIFQTNGFTQTDGNTGCAGLSGCAGYPMGLDPGMEDFIVEHNTFYDLRGSNPQMWAQATAQWMHGCSVKNNLWFFGTNTAGFSANNGSALPNPSISGTGSSLFNAMCTNDPHVPSGVMAGNVAVPFYTNGITPLDNSIVSAQAICTNFGGGTLSGTTCPSGLIGTVLSGSTASANLATVGFVPSGFVNAYTLSKTSAFLANAKVTDDNKDVGANINTLLTAQGAVGPVRTTAIGTTTASFSLFTYDGTVSCPVDIATSPNDPSTQTGGGRFNPTGTNTQTVNITGLITKTQYQGRWLCPVNQPTFNFITR